MIRGLGEGVFGSQRRQFDLDHVGTGTGKLYVNHSQQKPYKDGLTCWLCFDQVQQNYHMGCAHISVMGQEYSFLKLQS